jgi:hypothetical protein
MGEVEDFTDYYIEFNLDQRLDQRTYNKTLTSEVSAVWVEGSEHRGQFESSVVLHGKDTRFSFQGESSGGTTAFLKLV